MPPNGDTNGHLLSRSRADEVADVSLFADDHGQSEKLTSSSAAQLGPIPHHPLHPLSRSLVLVLDLRRFHSVKASICTNRRIPAEEASTAPGA